MAKTYAEDKVMVRLKQLDRRLDEEEVFVHLALTRAGVGVFEWDIQQDTVKTNDVMRDIVELPLADSHRATIATLIDAVVEEDRGMVAAEIGEAIDTGQKMCFSARFRYRAGQRRVVIHGQVAHNEHGEPNALYGVMMSPCPYCERDKSET